MKDIKFSYWFFIFIFCLSCTPNEDFGIKKIVLDDLDTIEKSKLTIQNIIPLETTPQNLMGNDIRVRFNQSSYYLMDENSKTVIHHFDRAGGYRGAVAQVGDGPDYLEDLDDFFINSDGSVEVLSGIGDQASVYQISESGEILPVFETGYLASSFTKLPSGEYLLYGSYNLPYTKHRLIKTDARGNERSSYLENSYKNSLLPMTERNFFVNGETIYVIESFQPYVYKFENDSLKRIAQVDFGAFAIPDYFWKEDIMESFGKMSESGFANLHGIFEDEQLMLLSIHVQKPEGVFKELVFIEKSTEKVQKLSTNMNDDLLYHYPIGIEEGEVMFLTYRSVMLDGLSESSLEKIQKEIPKKDFDYPVILKTKIQFDE